MSAPLQLDTSRPDWRRQATGKGNCRACGEEVLWCSFEDHQGHEIKRPYNYEDGQSHFTTCTAPRVFKESSAAQLHKCAVSTCGDQIPKGKLMCIWHWRKVNAETQAEVIRTWQDGDRRAWAAAARKATDQAEPRKAKAPKPEQKQTALFDGSAQTYGVD